MTSATTSGRRTPRLGRLVVTTPSFAQQSDGPVRLAEDLGLDLDRASDRHPLHAADLSALLRGRGPAEALLVGLDAVDDAVLASPGLRVVAKHGVGTDNVDLDAARRRGVRVVNAPGTNADAVADLTVGLLLALVRQVVPAHASVLAGRWERFPGLELGGRRIGVVGLGRIGAGVAARAAAFGMDVVAHDPFVTDEDVEARGARPLGLDELLESSDVVSLHLPASPGGPLLGAARLAGMRRGVVVVNAARGDLVDEQAVADALASGRLGGYAADAFMQEPPRSSPLLTAPRTLLTPHIGAHTDRANAAMGEAAVRGVAAVLRGEEPPHAVV